MIQLKAYHQRCPKIPPVPYVCMRVPTGGGKTRLACLAMCISHAPASSGNFVIH